MHSYYWDEDSWDCVPPRNADEICDAANILIDEWLEENDDDEDGAHDYSNELWEQYCAADGIDGVRSDWSMPYGVAPDAGTLGVWTDAPYKWAECKILRREKIRNEYGEFFLVDFHGKPIAVICAGCKQFVAIGDKQPQSVSEVHKFEWGCTSGPKTVIMIGGLPH